MNLKSGSFDEIAKNIKRNNKRIVVFGTGVIGKTIVQQILIQFDLCNQIEFYIDNDSSLWGESVNIGNVNIEVKSPEILNFVGSNVVIFVAISRFIKVYEQLEIMNCTKEMDCYIVPMLLKENYKSYYYDGIINKSEETKIPKIIHYMWLGGNEIPRSLNKCIESWKKYCPDYEVICWDENNYDIKKSRYMQAAYESGKYGFVPDYARLDILYSYGGIYLDTDVELIRPLDDLLYQEAFTSVEKWQVINFGGGSGAVKGHLAVKAFLDEWEKREYYRKDGSHDPVSSGIIDTKVAFDNGYILNGKNQSIMGMNIYTYDYFHPYDYMSGKIEITPNTYGIHHFNGGWLDEGMREANRITAENYDKICKLSLKSETR